MSQQDEFIDNIINALTIEQKVSLCYGCSNWSVTGIKNVLIPGYEIEIPELTMTDGPHGIRDYGPTYLPVGSSLASTWNINLAYKFGDVLGKEARIQNYDIVLGPGVNIQRTPLGGRFFEYFSEDPHLIARMAIPVVKGIQQNNVSACVKHFALNNQELSRKDVNVHINDKALWEIYLMHFERIIKEAKPGALMAAYNKFRNEPCVQNPLLYDILRNCWHYDGLVISDWKVTGYNAIDAANAGLDVEMPYMEHGPFKKDLLQAVKQQQVSEEKLNEKVKHVLEILVKSGKLSIPGYNINMKIDNNAHANIARQISNESIILLKNTIVNNKKILLPLNKLSNGLKIAIIGENANVKHGYLGGSSRVKSTYEITPFEGLASALKPNIEINCVLGYSSKYRMLNDPDIPSLVFAEKDPIETFKKINPEIGDAIIPLDQLKNPEINQTKLEELMKEAVKVATEADIVLLFVGQNHWYDTEKFDRPDMKLHHGQNQLIEAVLNVNPNTIVTVISGSPVEMPWIDQAPAVIYMGYAGMEGGNSIADILIGTVNPSGKLPFTMPKKLNDSAAHYRNNPTQYPGKEIEEYQESDLVGYRHFEYYNIEPLFCFGHGLSYTTFQYSDLRVSKENDEYLIKFEIKNIGTTAGSEIAQLYIKAINPKNQPPIKLLKGFEKVSIGPSETETIELKLSDFGYYNSATKQKEIENKYEILIGSSINDIRLCAEVTN